MKSGSLTQRGLHFLCLSLGDLKNDYFALFCRNGSCTPNWLKDTSIRSSTAVEISDLNSQYCGNSVPNQFFQPCHLFGQDPHLTVM